MTTVSGTPTYGNAGPMSDASVDYPSGAFHSRSVVSTATNNFTFLAWVKRSGNTSGFLFQNGAGGSNGWTLDFTNTAGAMRVVLQGVGNLGATFTIADNTWTMIVIMRNAGIWQSYANGVVANAAVGSAAPNTPTGITKIVGAAASGVTWSHVAYVNSVVLPLDIATLYQIGQKVVIPL